MDGKPKGALKCAFCDHPYKAHDFTATQSAISHVPCADCADGICRDPLAD